MNCLTSPDNSKRCEGVLNKKNVEKNPQNKQRDDNKLLDYLKRNNKK